jgi:hypothetical protein
MEGTAFTGIYPQPGSFRVARLTGRNPVQYDKAPHSSSAVSAINLGLGDLSADLVRYRRERGLQERRDKTGMTRRMTRR